MAYTETLDYETPDRHLTSTQLDRAMELLLGPVEQAATAEPNSPEEPTDLQRAALGGVGFALARAKAAARI